MRIKLLLGVVVAVLVVMTVISAISFYGGPEGKYVYSQNPDIYIILKHDGTYVNMDNGNMLDSGTWKQYFDTIKFQSDDTRLSVRVKLEDGVLHTGWGKFIKAKPFPLNLFQ